MQSKATFDEFDSNLRPDWEGKAEKELKGKPLSSLNMTVDNQEVSPIAFNDEVVSPWADASSRLKPQRPFGGWGQRVDVKTDSLVDAKQMIAEALSQGANAIGLDLNIQSSAELTTLFKDVQIDIVDIHFYGKCSRIEIIEWFVDLIDGKNLNKNEIRGSVEWAINESDGSLTDEISTIGDTGLVHFKTRSLDLTGWQNEGGGLVGELGCALSHLHHVLVSGLDRGIPIDQMTATMAVRLCVGQEYLLEISKFRALRLLWKTIVEQYEPEHGCSTTLQVDACTSTWNYTARDERSNHLRATTAAMSAVIGGVDGLCIMPHSSTYCDPTPSHRRLAVNIHHLLKYESYLDQVDDPARGSYLIEKLTAEMADQAWKIFQESEALDESQRQNFWQKKLVADREAQSEKKLLGVNLHQGKMPDQFEGFVRSTWENTFGKGVDNA